MRKLIVGIALASVLMGGTALAKGGDANCDEAVSVDDALTILQADAGLLPVSALCIFEADVNQDGRVTAVDAALILQLDAGLIDALPGALTA